MNHKKFSDEIWSRVLDAIRDVTSGANSKAVAVFDADGTLWETDMGEAFFAEQIRTHFLNTTVTDPRKYYFDKKHAGQTREAYLWLAQILEGYTLTEVRRFAAETFEQNRKRALANDGEFIFQSQRELIELFRRGGIEIFVVTASIKWAVEPGAAALGIDADHVLGIETEIENERVTSRGVFPITYREGKLQKLKEKCGRKPFFACGNTLGDLALLEAATHLPLAVRSHSSKDHLCATEDELYQIARRERWLTHTF